MCVSMVDIQSPTAEIRRGKEGEEEETTGQNIMSASATHETDQMLASATITTMCVQMSARASFYFVRGQS